MPSRRPCLQKGVPFHLSEPGKSRCAAHAGWPERPGMGGDWPAIRKHKLAANPRCERCWAKATTVDHIFARAFGGTHAPGNLMSLCARCAALKDHADREEGKRRARVEGGGGRTHER
jgi:5-methylcytosine-specific restriction endonuclease McrA